MSRRRSSSSIHRFRSRSRSAVSSSNTGTENLRVVTVFGKGALTVSPRIGHIHITVDDLPWHFVDASGQTIILAGLTPGPHQALIELADPTHKVITSETIKFRVPDTEAVEQHNH